MSKRLTRSKSDRMLSGVCGGIASTYGWDPTLIRIIIVVCGLLTAIVPLLIAYIIAIFILPDA